MLQIQNFKKDIFGNNFNIRIFKAKKVVGKRNHCHRRITDRCIIKEEGLKVIKIGSLLKATLTVDFCIYFLNKE